MWEIGLAHQLLSSGYALAIGIFFAAVYDILKACCIVNNAGGFAVFVKDILFSLFAFFVTFMLLMARSNGIVRGYILFWIFTGFLLFRLSVSKFWLKIFMFVFRKIKALSSWVHGNFLVFCDMLDRFESILIKILRKFLQKVKKLIKNS